MSKNWLKKWVSTNPKETTDIVSKSIDAISKIDLNQTFNQFNRMAENINRGKEIENDRIKIQKEFLENMRKIEIAHNGLEAVINKNNGIIDSGIADNDYEKIRIGVAANVQTARDLIQGLNSYELGDHTLSNDKKNDAQGYIDIT